MIWAFEKAFPEYVNFIDCPDVNASGIRRFTQSPVFGTFLTDYHFGNDYISATRTQKHDFLQLDGQTYTFQTKRVTSLNDTDRYVIPTGVTHHPENWCGDPAGFYRVQNVHDINKRNLFHYLHPRYLRDLQQQRAFLLLDQTHEGYQTEWLWGWFHYHLERYQIPATQIIYITGNMKSREQYERWCEVQHIRTRMYVVRFPIFERMIYMTALYREKDQGLPPLPTLDEQIQFKTHHLEDIRAFNILQKRLRRHRMWFYKLLSDHDLLRDAIVSMNKFTGHDTRYNGREMTPDDIERLNQNLPLVPPQYFSRDPYLIDFTSDPGEPYQKEMSEDIILRTWVSVISEASFGDDEHTCFISEKTFKNFATCHPFYIMGNRYSLEVLREMGYQTFSPYIDESYDRYSTWERFDAIIESMKRFSLKTPNEKLFGFLGLQEILRENQENLKRNVKQFPSVLADMFKYIGE